VLLLHAPTNSAAARINKASNDFMGRPPRVLGESQP
jgi:hypothetical protein